MAKQAHYKLDALRPDGSGMEKVLVSGEKVDAILRHHGRHKFYELSGDPFTKNADGSCVQEVLAAPKHILEGVRRYQKGGLCYCGIPSRGWFNCGGSGPPPPGKVFLVFLNPQGEIFEWGWDPASHDDPSLPAGYDDKERFSKGVIWSAD